VDGAFSGCVSNGFCGIACATGPEAPAMKPPVTALTSSIDFPQV
jgi:hypothetical protein